MPHGGDRFYTAGAEVTRVPPQSAAMSNSRSYSSWSTASCQRRLVAVHSAAYLHRVYWAGGNHSKGS